MKTLALASAVLLFPLLSSAQDHPTDPKWNAWLGCWELVLENARDGSTRPSPSRRPLQPSTGSTRPQVCVNASGNGVTLTTQVGTQTPIQQTLIADGADHPITDADCRGTQRAEWSRDGRKVYSKANLSCSADKGNRSVSGFSILGANGTWTDVQAVDVSGQQTVRVRSYRRLSEVAQIGKGLTHATPLTIDDVKEASSKVSPRALEAALVETGASFDLSGKDLIALQDAKVPGSVTDLMIALSYPERFVVERRRGDTAPLMAFADDPFFTGWAFGYPTWWDYGFYSYGPYSPYFYSPFYSYLPWYYYGGGGGVIIIDDGIGSGGGGGGGGGGQITPSGRGRVIDGVGYTRVRPREAEPTPHASTGSGASSSGGSSASSSGGGGGGSVSSQGFSSGGSGGGDGGGRTAQPR